MAIERLQACGLHVLARDLYHLCWLLADMRKSQGSVKQAALANLAREVVLPLLAVKLRSGSLCPVAAADVSTFAIGDGGQLHGFGGIDVAPVVAAAAGQCEVPPGGCGGCRSMPHLRRQGGLLRKESLQAMRCAARPWSGGCGGGRRPPHLRREGEGRAGMLRMELRRPVRCATRPWSSGCGGCRTGTRLRRNGEWRAGLFRIESP